MIFITGDTHGPDPIGLHSVDGFGRRFNEACHELMRRVGGEWNDELVDTFWQMWQARGNK